jgi:hypothetical protein
VADRVGKDPEPGLPLSWKAPCTECQDGTLGRVDVINPDVEV